MKRRIIVVVGLLFCTSGLADEMPFSDLKAKGATVLSEDEVKQLLTGATVRYESASNNTQMKLAADGSVQGFSTPRIGAAAATPFDGKWRIESNRWCVETRRGFRFCRDVIKAGDKYYSSLANTRDESRLASELAVTR